jgi:hypothetical protein
LSQHVFDNQWAFDIKQTVMAIFYCHPIASQNG